MMDLLARLDELPRELFANDRVRLRRVETSALSALEFSLSPMYMMDCDFL